MTSIFTSVLLVIHVAICLLLCLVVLMQRPKQEGLGAAFGGGMTDQAFGARTTDVLQKGTVYLGTLLFIVTLALSVLVSSSGISAREDAKAVANTESQITNAAKDLPADSDAEEDADLDKRIKNEAGEGEAETPKEEDKAPTPAPVDPAPAPTTPEGSEKDTATGAIIGAAAGGIIGHQSGKAKEGAAIGAAAGGTAGPAQPEEPKAPAETPQP